MLAWAVSNETFSSELRDVHERRPGERDSFNDEFRGASDSLIAKDRPELVGGRGRGAVIALVLTLSLPVLIGAPVAIWYWAEPIGHWLAGTEAQVEATEPAMEPEPVAPVAVTPTPEPPAVEKVFGIRGAPDGSDPGPTPEPVQPDAPVQDPPLQPDAPASQIEAVSTTVRGNVGSTAVSAELDKLDAALVACWTKTGASGSIELQLDFGITRDGNLRDISLSGGSEALHTCVREALPTSSWPQPLDGGGGEASVNRTWKLGA
jgi:hypothetical protein